MIFVMIGYDFYTIYLYDPILLNHSHQGLGSLENIFKKSMGEHPLNNFKSLISL